MEIWEIILIGIGLAADAFAVSVGKGLTLKEMSWKTASIIGLYFGFFQGFMPYLGYLSAKSIGIFITKYSGVITFGLLFLIGANMIREALKKDKEKEAEDVLGFGPMLALSLATSIDAFAVGITFSFIEINIWFSVFIIGIITFVLSCLGVKIGNAFGNLYEKSAQIIGGMILISIGIKALLQIFSCYNSTIMIL